MKSTMTNKRSFIISSIMLSLALFFSCSPSDDDANAQGPKIISSSPVNGSTDNTIDAVVTVAFDKDVLNVNNTSNAFTLRRLGSAADVPAEVAYSRATKTATLTPQEQLDIDTVYVVTLSDDIIDYNRNVLTGAPVTWVFTTGVADDSDNPTVVLQDPYAGEQNVAVDADINIRFSEAVANVTTSTFKLEKQISGETYQDVAGTVQYDGTINSAVFNPDSTLVDGVQYRVTLTGGAGGIADIAGNPLDATGLPLQWAFKTLDGTPPFVVRTTPADNDIEVPRESSVIVEFSEQVANVTTSTFILKVKDSGVEVPSSVTYNKETKEATLSPVYSELEANTEYAVTLKGGVGTTVIKDYSGNSLAGDVNWTFTTATDPDNNPPTVSGKNPDSGEYNVSVNKSVEVEFSEAVTGITKDSFMLKQGGSQVSAGYSYNPDTKIATLDPVSNLSEGAVYTVSLTGAIKDLAGNPLTDATWSFTTVDSVHPYITVKTPDDGDTNVPMNGSVIILFNEPVSSVNSTSVKLELSGAGTPVSAVVHYADIGSYDGSPQATLYPDNPLDPLTEYKVTVTDAIVDKSYNANSFNDGTPVDWTFTTTDAEDTTSPYVLNMYPAENATEIGMDAAITAVFSEQVEGVGASSVSLKETVSGKVVSALVMYNAATKTVTLEPNQNLIGSTFYTVTLTGGITDTSGNHNVLKYQNGDPAPVMWEFKTKVDKTDPSIVSQIPTAGIGGVDVDTKVIVAFSEEVKGVDDTSFKLIKTSTSTEIPAEVKWDGIQKAYVLTPDIYAENKYLDQGAEYEVVLAGTISDTALPPNYLNSGAGISWKFTTIGDTTAPVVLTGSEYPEPDAQGVAVGSNVTATFSEAINPATVTKTTVTLTPDGGDPIAGVDVKYNDLNNTVTLNPDVDLTVNTTYHVKITGIADGIQDLAGNDMQSHYTWSFTTGDQEDNIDPTVLDTRSPGPGATGIATNLAGVVVEFSEKVSNVSQSTFTLRAGVTTIQGTVTYDSINKKATFAPKYNLTTGTEYTVMLSGFITDLSGNPLYGGTGDTWSFTASTTDNVPPKVISGYPSKGDTGINVRPEVTAVFSESVLNVNKNYFRLMKVSNSEYQAADITYEDSTKTATLIPRSILEDNTEYAVVLTSASITDLAANTLDLNGWTSTLWRFTTSTAPKLSSSTPADGSIGITLSTNQVTLTFDKDMDPAKGNAVISGGNVTLGTPTWSTARTITYPINGKLDGNTQYTITYSSWWELFYDSAGNPLRASQTTVQQIKIANFDPFDYRSSDGRVRVPSSVNLTPAIVGDVFVDASGSEFVINSITYNTQGDGYKRIYINPGQTVNVNPGANIVVYPLGVVHFTTAADSTSPYVVSRIPSGFASFSKNIQRIVVSFNERMDTSKTASLIGSGILGNPVWLDGAKTASFPVSGLNSGGNGIDLNSFQDASGNLLDKNTSLVDGVLYFTLTDDTAANIYSYGFEIDPGTGSSPNPASDFPNEPGDSADWVLSSSSKTPAAIPSEGSGMISANTLEWNIDEYAHISNKDPLNFKKSGKNTIILSFDVAHDIYYPANDRVEVYVNGDKLSVIGRYDPYFKSVDQQRVPSFDPISYASGRSGGYVTVESSVDLSQSKKGDYFKDSGGQSFAISFVDNYNHKFFISIFQNPSLSSGATIYRRLWWGRHDVDLSSAKDLEYAYITLKAISAGPIGSNILIDNLSIRGY